LAIYGLFLERIKWFNFPDSQPNVGKKSAIWLAIPK